MNTRFPLNDPLEQRALTKRRRAFSLVEVTLAIGIFSFCMLTILALLPMGLKEVRRAVVQSGVASIGQHLRTELLGMSFDADNPNGVQNLPNQTFYFTERGVRTTDVDPDAFFQSSFALQNVGLGATPTYPSSGRMVAVEVTYPMSYPEASREKTLFSLFVARQANR
jgi:uncharacterized protein (TIGR02598 family)